MRSVLLVASLVSSCVLAACGGVGESLSSKQWTVQSDMINAGFVAIVFDASGNLVANGTNSKHTYRYDVKAEAWSDLGDQGFNQIVLADFEGTVYTVGGPSFFNGSWTEYDNDLYKLVGDTWEKAAELSGVGETVAFGAGGAVFSFVGSDSKLEIHRKTPTTDWVKTYSATKEMLGVIDPTLFTVQSDNVGNVYLTIAGATSQLSADGTTLTKIAGCALAMQPEASCNVAVPYFDERGGQTFIAGDHEKAGVYRASAGATTATRVVGMPPSFIYVQQVLFDRRGTLYMAASPDNVASTTPSLIVLDADASEWKIIGETPGLYYQLVVRGDGEVFAYNPMNGTLYRLQ